MTVTMDIGGTASDESAAPELVPIYIAAGGTGTTVTVNSGDTINYYTSLDAPPAGTITAGNNLLFTISPLWLSSNSISSVTFTGQGY